MRLLACLAAALLAVPALGAAAAERLIVVGGGVTEIVFALGGGEGIVGVDTTSIFPPATDALPKVGYQRTLSAEGLLSLAPTRLLASADAGPPAVLAQLRRAGIAIDQLGEDHDPAHLPARIRRVGALVGRAAAAEAVAEAVAADLALVAAAAARVADRPRVLFVLSAGRGAPLASGTGTAAHGVITAAGAVNAIDRYAGYKPLTPEAATLADPDVVLVTHQTLEALGGAEALLALPGLAGGRAQRGQRVVALDALFLLGFGPRLPQAIAAVMAGLHGPAAAPVLPSRPWAAGG